MLEPVSTTLGICLGYAALQPYARVGTALSSEAETVRQAASAVIEQADRSQALFGEKLASISKLITIAQDCSEPDWDGAGALPVDASAVATAEAFLRALPPGHPLPDLAPECDGGISLDWIRSRTRMFSVSIGPTERLSYAWLDGSDMGHGVARFDGHQVPPRVLEGIRSIATDANASLRAA